MAARAPVTSTSRVLGIVGAATPLWGPESVQRSVEAACRAAGFFTTTWLLRGPVREAWDVCRERLRVQDVDGVLVIGADDGVLDAMDQAPPDVPWVVVGTDGTRADRASVVDQEAGARAVTRHLLELGHRDVAHLAGPDTWADARARIKGWRGEMVIGGLEPRHLWAGDWSAASGHDAATRLLGAGAPTAVFCANDQMALGLLAGLHEAGVDVPGSVSVAGFDDIPAAAYLHRPLTTVRPDLERLGQVAADSLLARMGVDGAGRTAPPAPTLVVRASTGPPGARTPGG